MQQIPNFFFYFFNRYLTIFIIFHSSGNFSSAQIDETQLNKKLLEHEIKVLIDSTRLANKLVPLFNDSILYVASNHHADYLLKKGALSHEETENKQFYTPQDRANQYGAPKTYLVGENIAYTHYNASVNVKGKKFQTYNYKEIARSLVFSWINSKGHFKNIINPDYQITGLAISIDPTKQRVYACQKFAHVIYTYSFEENKEFFPYSRMSQDSVDKILAQTPNNISYPYGLRFNKNEKCDECKATWEEYPAISVRISNNYFILRIEDSEFVKKLIKNRNDGFAIELVPFDAFACGNPAYQNEPSRRNGLKRTSGRLLIPKYRNDLLKGFKKRKKQKDLSFVKHLLYADSVSFFKRFGNYKLVNFSSKYFEIKLGKIPKDMNTWWNHNLVYIHNKQICHIVYLTSYPGELEVKMIDVPYYPPIPVNDYEFNLEFFKDTVELYYEPGKTIANSKELDVIISNYKKNNLTIKSILIEGFSSVEGNLEDNELLHRERAENILTQLGALIHADTLYRVTSQVAWDHFYSSVKDHPKWKFLYPLSKSEIIDYLTDPNNERPLDILARERMAKVEIIGIRELNPTSANYYVKRDLNNLFYKDKRGKLQCTNTNTLQKLYEKAFYFTTVDTMTVQDFLSIQLLKFEGHIPHPIMHDVVFYRYHYLKYSSEFTGLSKLESEIENVFNECGAAEHLSPEFHYLSACLLVEKIKNKKNKNTADNPDIQKAFDRLNLLLTWYDLDSSFRLNVAKANLNIINTLCETIDPEQLYEYNGIVNNSLIHIVEYYRHTNQLNPETVVSLSKLLCYFQNIPLAIALCDDFLYDNEVLKIYLPLAYIHSSYLSSKDFLEFEIHFQTLLIDARERLTKKEWCALFYGKYGIPFQVMDNKQLHTEFCETCPNRVNDIFEEQK